MRTPLAKLRQSDAMACEATVAMQMLYMIEKLEEKDFGSFDRLIGRERGMPDLKGGSFEKLLQAGFHFKGYLDGWDVKRFLGANGLAYWRDFHRKTGQSEESINKLSPRLFEQLKERTLALGKIEKRYKKQVSATPAAITFREFEAVLKNRHMVVACICRGGGYAHMVLITELEGKNCTVYDPATGLSLEESKKFFRTITPDVSLCWHSSFS